MIALAVGPDADVSALEKIIGKETGLVLRVNEAAELPLVMRSGFERRRARVERGAIAVEQQQVLPFSPGTWSDWPAITAHHVTRSQPDALIAVQTRRGEPLIALHRAGRGRVVAVTCGLGPWAASWLQWREWPRLAGGLADWISGEPQAGTLALAVSDLPAGLQVEGDLQGGADGRDPNADVVVNTPRTQGRRLEMDAVAPGRVRATLPDDGPGLYTFLVSNSHGTQTQLHLRHQRGESEAWGTNPALSAWRSAGLIGDWDPAFIAPRRDGRREPRPVDRSLIGLALALFVSGVLVDRSRPNIRSVREALRRWRTRT